MEFDNQSKVEIIKSLFKGREDVFAIRWEKNGKNGYMPAYFYDPYRYRIHKMNGGSFQNFSEKSYLKLSDNELTKHLNGEHLIRIYPLLADNTSWFLVADFDKQNWLTEAKLFIEACQINRVPAYLERSRSGNGGHVWIFFEQPIPAIQSRKIFLSILQNSGAFSVFDKSSSFDRLFPNQDYLTGKGLGNLIALPFYKKTYDEGNSCFIDTETLKPIENQWNFLQNINKVPIEKLLELLSKNGSTEDFSQKTISENLEISLKNQIDINRNGLPKILINFLKEELNFANSEFIIKKKIGKNTFGTDRFFKLLEETPDEIIIPRGFIGRLIRFCRINKIEHVFKDDRKKITPILFKFNAHLHVYQQTAIEVVSKKDFGVIVAPPGSGKTLIGLKIIAEKQQPALIIVHRKQLMEQWMERIETFLGIPKHEIGKIGEGKTKIGEKITIATIQSLVKPENINQNFGIIIVDECHHIPANSFRNTISKFNSYYLYGLTATPFRKYNDGKIIFTHLGEIIYELKSSDISQAKPKIIVKDTVLDVPFNTKTDNFETLSKILIHDSGRNKLILEDVKTELDLGKKCVIITERKEHIDSLYQYLKQSFEAITLSGDDSEKSRKEKWKILAAGNYQVLITTGQFFGEGIDLQNANCLFLVYPFSFEGKLVQYIGRVQRSEIAPTIYDYRDLKIDYLNKLFLKRNTYYRKIEKQISLFDEPIEQPTSTNNLIKIDKTIKVLIEDLQFIFGTISFIYEVPELKFKLEFTIENQSIRPEFDVLKPYFTKVLNTKFVNVAISTEIENEQLVSQLAVSEDIEKINREFIEGVKFRFISKFIGGQNFNKNLGNLQNSEEIQSNISQIYSDDKALLDDILKNKNYKHSPQLRFLANRHEGRILKIRFVLIPFSFVFLIEGEQQYHIILETLDTEEATYLWHFNKNEESFKSKIIEIDSQLNIIRNKGRQAFLETEPIYFSRITHDYSDDRKGFIIWKDLLEERLV